MKVPIYWTSANRFTRVSFMWMFIIGFIVGGLVMAVVTFVLMLVEFSRWWK